MYLNMYLNNDLPILCNEYIILSYFLTDILIIRLIHYF